MEKHVPRDRFGRFNTSNNPNDFRKDPRVARIKLKCLQCKEIKEFVPW